jgi:hypothetical protein
LRPSAPLNVYSVAYGNGISTVGQVILSTNANLVVRDLTPVCFETIDYLNGEFIVLAQMERCEFLQMAPLVASRHQPASRSTALVTATALFTVGAVIDTD